MNRLSKRLERGIFRALHQSLAYTMTTSRRTLRKRKSSSPPGRPPHRHVKQKSGFGFQRYEIDTHGLDVYEGIVGPTRFPRGKRTPPPSVNEFGGKQILTIVPLTRSGQVIAPDGTVPKRKKGRDGKMYPVKGKKRRTAKIHRYITTKMALDAVYDYPKRKFQHPALRAVIKSKKIPKIFAENILGRKRAR